MRAQRDGLATAVCVVATGVLAVVPATPLAGVARAGLPPPAQPAADHGDSDAVDRGVGFDGHRDAVGPAATAAGGGGGDALAPAAVGHPAVASPGGAPRQPGASAAAAAALAPSAGTSAGTAGEPDTGGEPQWRWPAEGRVSSEFGPRWGRLHEGIDIAAAHGSPIVAAAGGRVTAAGTRGGYGLVVEVAHPNGTTTVYAHLSAVRVATDEVVAGGERLGAMGCSGSCTGSHLHFEVRRNETVVDPRGILP